MPNVEHGVAREALAERLDIREPAPVKAVGEKAVPVVVDLVAEEDHAFVAAEQRLTTELVSAKLNLVSSH